MARNTRLFSDIDLNFTKHPVTRDITRRYDENAIKASVKNLLLTRNFERPFHPEIGTQVNALLFENFSPASRIALERTIVDAIEKFEPRVRIIDISVNETSNSNDLVVNVVFSLKNIDRPITVSTFLSRVR
jgi:phage baseplate assembly protein W